MRVSFFIDGQNLFHNLKALDRNLKEENINWHTLFSSCLEEGDEIEVAYWFRPKDIDEQVKLTRNKLYKQKIIEKYPERQSELIPILHQLPKEIFRVLKPEYDERLEWWSNEKKRFWSVHRKYLELETEYTFIKLYLSGVLKMDTYKKQPVGEKGVDVAIAVKIVESVLNNECDRVVLVSSDSDYEEVANTLKRHNKHITCLSFENSISRRLSDLVDNVIDVSLEDLLTVFKK